MTMRSTHTDAVIVGGGPGGAMCALKLARLGWRVMLVERGPRNRHKACGHCLNHRAMDCLRREGLLGAVTAHSATGTTRFRVHASNGATLEASWPLWNDVGLQAGIVVDRSRLDQILLDRAASAGAAIIQPGAARIRSLDAGGIEVGIAADNESQITRTNLLVGADGLGSGVARAAGLVTQREAGRKFGFSFDFVPDRRAMSVNRDSIEMFLVPGGYLGFVSQGRETVHVAALVGDRTAGAREPLAFVHEAARRHPRLEDLGLHRMNADDMEHLKAIGPMPWRSRIVTQSFGDAHIALVGDAAGYVEPFTGEGISWAMSAAEALAQCAASCAPGRWTALDSRRYQQLWKDRVGRRQRLCSALAWALDRPTISNVMLRLAALWPRLADRVAAEVVTA